MRSIVILRFFIIISVIACVSCGDWGWPDVRPQLFDAKLWHEFDSAQLTFSGPQPRLAMLDDLREHHLKTGMPRDQVLVLLGQPDYRPEEVPSGQPRVDEYLVGESISDPISLDCMYDAHGKLTGTRVVEH